MPDKIKKDYRFGADTLQMIETMKDASVRTSNTAIIEASVQYVYGEYLRAIRGMDHDELALCHVLGKPVEKAV